MSPAGDFGASFVSQVEVIYDRDSSGAPFAIEVVEATGWDDAFLEPPAPEDADARVVELQAGRPPAELPEWLRVELMGMRLAERGPATSAYGGAAAPSASARRLGRAVWSSIEQPAPASSFAEFLAAGATAVAHPARVSEAVNQQQVLAGFCRDRPHPLGRIAELEGVALEWWLARRFGDADSLAESVLLVRIRERDVAAAEALEFLRLAAVPEKDADFAELAVDRGLLLAHASPWRYFEAGGMVAALAAVLAWRTRYRAAYRPHAEALRGRATELRRLLAGEMRAVRALERLDRTHALGDPIGLEATTRFRDLQREITDFLPAEATTPLGSEPAIFAAAQRAISDVRAILERQRERLAAATVRLVLERPGERDLDRLLQAIQASNLEGLERVLDDRLAAHIESLLEPLPQRATLGTRADAALV